VRERIIAWLTEREVFVQSGIRGMAVVVQRPGGVCSVPNSVPNGEPSSLAISCFATEIENLVYELVGRETLKKEKP
jgi:hypothetical protein